MSSVVPQSVDLRTAVQASVDSIKSDYYLFWLLGTTGGHMAQGHSNLMAFDFAIRWMPLGGSVLEIGTYLGQSANCLSYLMWKHQRFARLVCCDPYHFEDVEKPLGGFFNAGTAAYRDYCLDTCQRNLTMFSGHHLPHLVVEYSHALLQQWQEGRTVTDRHGRELTLGGPIGFAYVDGAHTYEAVHGDFWGLHPHLMPGGFVFFDDSTPNWEGVHRVMQEILQHPEYELLFTSPNYFFRKKPTAA